MAAYAYYAEENARHAETKAIKLTREQMLEATSYLCGAYGLNGIPVYFSDQPAPNRRRSKRGNWSWFRHNHNKPEHFSYGIGMFNLLTVAHEVAHYVHFAEQLKKRNAWVAQSNQNYWWKYKMEPSHGLRHRQIVDDCVSILRHRDWTLTRTVEDIKASAERMLAEVKADPVAAFYKTLPDFLTCPHCNGTKPKSDFGVRVMKKDAEGNPAVIRRQSWCRGCR